MLSKVISVNTSAREHLVPNPKLRLRAQFHEVARFQHLSLRTERTYWDWARRYLVFHKDKTGAWRHPRDMGANELRSASPRLGGAGIGSLPQRRGGAEGETGFAEFTESGGGR